VPNAVVPNTDPVPSAVPSSKIPQQLTPVFSGFIIAIALIGIFVQCASGLFFYMSKPMRKRLEIADANVAAAIKAVSSPAAPAEVAAVSKAAASERILDKSHEMLELKTFEFFNPGSGRNNEQYTIVITYALSHLSITLHYCYTTQFFFSHR
jgi:hypothetical protein